jgi:broad-specificity NMP kinase
VSLNNQREITLILKRDKRKSISVEVNKKKHFIKELTKYKNTVIDTTLPKFINLFSSKANSLGRTTR